MRGTGALARASMADLKPDRVRAAELAQTGAGRGRARGEQAEREHESTCTLLEHGPDFITRGPRAGEENEDGSSRNIVDASVVLGSSERDATRPTAPRGARRIATLARSGQQACAGTCALRHHSRHNSAPALPPPSDDVCWGQSTPASSLIAREARLLAAASDLRRRLDRRWPRWRPT